MAKDIESLKVAFGEVVDEWLSCLLERFGWNAAYGYWVADDKSGVYMYGDEYTLSLSDIIYIVTHDVALDDFEAWHEYVMFALDFGLTVPNLPSWMSGCPHLDAKARERLEQQRDELNKTIDNYKKKY